MSWRDRNEGKTEGSNRDHFSTMFYVGVQKIVVEG